MNHPEPTVARPRNATGTFREAYCRKHGCEPGDFLYRALWTTIYPQAQFVALFLGPRAECFTADRALIEYCGGLHSLEQIDAELAEFSSLRKRGFARRFLRIRVSGRRLKKLAARCLRP